MKWNTFLKSKRFKYGTISVVFTCVFVALILALNLLLSSLGIAFGLAVDLSEEAFTSISEDSKQILDSTFKLLPEDYVITVYFCAARDLYENNVYSLYIRDLAEAYADMYKGHIKVEYLDISRDPLSVDKYQDETGTSITASNVIVQGPYHYRILTLDAFLVLNEENELYAFNGELKFTSAFLQCSIEEPQKVMFTVKHGENVNESDATAYPGGKMFLKEVYRDAGFDVSDIDLSNESIPDETRILIIYKPTNDFEGYSVSDPNKITEIDKIDEYVNEYNNLIVFVDSSTPELPNLQEYLYESWGIGYKAFHKISDMTNSMQGSDGYAITGLCIGDTDTFGYQIFQKAISGSGTKLVFNNSVELFIDEKAAQNGVVIEQVISTGEGAVSEYTYTQTSDDGKVQTVTDKNNGQFPLILMSRYMNYKNDDWNYNTQIYQYVLLVASTDFASNDYLEKAYGNRSVMMGAQRLISAERITPDIPYRKILSDPIEIETGTATALTIIVSAVAPLVLIIAGIVVFARRRHL